jgi:hypothetical protein
LAIARSLGGNAEQIRETDQFLPIGVRRKLGRPTKQEWDSTRAFEKVLFLPAMVVAEEVTMIREETNQRVLGIRTRFDAIENPSETGIDV